MLLLASGLRLIGVPTGWVLAAVAIAVIAAVASWLVIRGRPLRVPAVPAGSAPPATVPDVTRRDAPVA